MWHLNRAGGNKTAEFAESFIKNIKQIFNDYMLKDAPPGDGSSDDVPF
jgi:hypothetical protein